MLAADVVIQVMTLEQETLAVSVGDERSALGEVVDSALAASQILGRMVPFM